MIPVNQPLFSSREKELLCQCIDSGWISSDGPFVEEFEKRFASLVGCRHGVAVANGTVALELAVRALDLKPGSKIIVPTFTIISCILAALRNGLKPVLVDADPDTWCMDIEDVRQVFRNEGNISAIMAVHIYGHPCDMESLRELSHEYGLRIIEDAAEAHGAKVRLDKEDVCLPCGSIGDVGVFSFYANKIITTGEGGMLTTNDDEIAERARILRNLAFQPRQRFLHEQLGYNFRLSNLQAAVGLAQAEHFDVLVERKKKQGRHYQSLLQGIRGIHVQRIKPWATPVFWVNGIVLDDTLPIDAVGLARRLQDRGIQTRPFFWPMHEQPAILELDLGQKNEFPVAERLARRGLYLPSGMALSDNEINRVCGTLEEIIHAL